MQEQISKFIRDIDSQSTWSTKVLREKINHYFPFKAPTTSNSIVKSLIPEGFTRKTSTDTIKKYDIIYQESMQSVHYFLVNKVKDDLVTAFCISSKHKENAIHCIEKDRYFKGSCITCFIQVFPLDDCMNKFVRVYENRQEADLIFRKAKDWYKQTLNI